MANGVTDKERTKGRAVGVDGVLQSCYKPVQQLD